MSKIILIVLGVLLAQAFADNYAVLVAGSNGYYNYRHQADIAHAYCIMTSNGIPADNIIVMSYDDVARSSQNPFPGTLINQPNGPDVYKCLDGHIDYSGADVTPENFLAIITGQADKVSGGNGRVLKSGPNDKVFINFADHGAPGLIAFPSKYLYANDFMTALKQMHESKMYKEMTIYIEACESGSMFEDLPEDINIYATTAANAHESSYACFYDSKRNTYLGDCYSVNWMMNTDSTPVNNETLQQQYEIVKTQTTQSHVLQFGDLDIAKEMIGEFMSSGKNTVSKTTPMVDPSPADSRDIKMVSLVRHFEKLNAQNDPEAREVEQKMQLELLRRKHFDATFKALVHMTYDDDKTAINRAFQPAGPVSDFQCYAESMEHFRTYCGRLSDYGLKYARVLANICNSGVTSKSVKASLVEICA